MCSHVLNLQLQVGLGPLGSSLEGHVLQEVGNTISLGRFVPENKFIIKCKTMSAYFLFWQKLLHVGSIGVRVSSLLGDFLPEFLDFKPQDKITQMFSCVHLVLVIA